MNGVHDMGGMHGFGKVEPEPNEPCFHETWEGRVLAMDRALGRFDLCKIDVDRYWIEKLPPSVYLGASYYEKWLLSFEQLFVHLGVLDAKELAAGHALHPPKPLQTQPMTRTEVNAGFARPSYSRPAQTAARFRPADRVRTKNINPVGHTRLPRYARDRIGVIEAVRGCHVYPDAVVSDGRESPQWLYTVVFDARTLWGEDADPTVRVVIEAFEPYLVPA